MKATRIPSVEVLSRTVSSLRIQQESLPGMNPPPPAQGFVNLSAVYVSQVLHRVPWKKRLQVVIGQSRFQLVGRCFLFKIQSPINDFTSKKWQRILKLPVTGKFLKNAVSRKIQSCSKIAFLHFP